MRTFGFMPRLHRCDRMLCIKAYPKAQSLYIELFDICCEEEWKGLHLARGSSRMPSCQCASTQPENAFTSFLPGRTSDQNHWYSASHDGGGSTILLHVTMKSSSVPLIDSGAGEDVISRLLIVL